MNIWTGGRKWAMEDQIQKEFYEAYKWLDLLFFIKLKRLKWAGHVQ
jgi:hypothetical protein